MIVHIKIYQKIRGNIGSKHFHVKLIQLSSLWTPFILIFYFIAVTQKLMYFQVVYCQFINDTFCLQISI